MGSAFYIVTEREIPDFDSSCGSKALSAAERKLSSIATDLGVMPLIEFFSIDPAEAAAFMEDEGSDADSPLPPVTWFEAELGLLTVNALLKHIASNRECMPSAPLVLAELSEFQTALNRLELEAVRWHLGVDY